MKVLSIGNSFSQDAHKWLHKLAKLNGFQIDTVNLYIGGCSLETHWANVEQNNAYYDLERNGGESEGKISIADALKLEKWDIITLQQASVFSGLPESYEPYLKKLAEYVRAVCPEAKLYFHQTWGYEIDFDSPGFANYNNDQVEMFRRIKQTTESAAKEINAELLPVGTVIQAVREGVPEFDYKNGGLSLCRDGFHLSLDYGRFTAAAVWIRTLTGEQITAPEFESFDSKLLERLLKVVNGI